jgi:hypothetical protein
MKSPEPTSLKQVVAAHGRELAAIRRLLEEAAREAIKLHSPWGCWPKGSVFSGLTREKFLNLIQDCEEFAGTGVAVWSCGEDWVRVWLPGPKWLLKLRSRPKMIFIDDDHALPGLELDGVPRGFPVLLWRFNFEEDRLAHFTMARVVDVEWVMEAEAFEEIEIAADLGSQGATPAATVRGTGNDDDDLPGVVGRWDSDEQQSEDEATDTTDEDSHDDDDEGDTAVGEDNN